MKRMYIVIALFVLVGLWAVSCLGQMIKNVQTLPQNTQQRREPFDRMKRRMELRAEMHRRMMEKLMNGSAPNSDLFKDLEQQMNEMMSDAFTDSGAFPQTETSNFQSEWQESSTGRTLLITPQSKDQKLEIDTKPDVVTIKGKSEQKSEHGTSISSFNNSFSVPEDCDGTKVKMSQKDGKIVMEFPYKSMKSIHTPQKDKGRVPIAPSEGDVEI